MKLILLGTGTSTGIPEVGCGCMLCRSNDIRNKRLRTSALLVSRLGTHILIDCGPDFRQQANRIGLNKLDAIVLTHEHYDHVYGLDDLRTIAWKKEIPIYGQANVLEAVRRRMHYVFSDNPYPGTPKLSLNELEHGDRLTIKDVEIQPLLVMHGSLPILGYRFHQIGTDTCEDISYITDMKYAEPTELSKVDGSKLLVINALRHLKEHPSHQNVLDVLNHIEHFRHKPQLTVLTHLSHHAPSHQELIDFLHDTNPPVVPGYDFACISTAGIPEITTFVPQAEVLKITNYPISTKLLETDSSIGYIAISEHTDRSKLSMQIAIRQEAFTKQIDLQHSLRIALERIAIMHCIDLESLYQCIDGLKLLEENNLHLLSLSLIVNSTDADVVSMQSFCSGQTQDVTVIKHLLSGFLYEVLSNLVADKHSGSLSHHNN